MKTKDGRTVSLNDNDRAELVDNDEGLYDLWRSARPRQSKTAWIRENRQLIDDAVLPVLNNEQPAHHLKYGVYATSNRPMF